MSDSFVFGIDLGTSNSCIAYFDGTEFQLVAIDDDFLVPSVVAITPAQEILIGKSAIQYGQTHPERTVSSIKRFIGDNEWFWELDGRHFNAIDLSSYILKYLKSEAEKILGVSVLDVVITVPAYFDEIKRRATLSAGESAGLHVIQLLNEPTAAALSYDIQKTEIDLIIKKDHDNITDYWLVYDLGGGTFDVTVLKVQGEQGEQKEVLASSGDGTLGGDDFDQRVCCYLLQWLTNKYEVDFLSKVGVRSKLKNLSQYIKLTLSESVVAHIDTTIEIDENSYPIKLDIDRELFDKLIVDFIDYTLEKVRSVLSSCHLSVEIITKLVLVGGSTRIPLVQDKLKHELGLIPYGYIDPDLSVALGAAVATARGQGLHFNQTIIDVAPHSLGLAVWGELDQMLLLHTDGQHPHFELNRPPLTFAPIIFKNSRLPARFIKTFYTSIENQEIIPLALYQGESYCTNENYFVGVFTVSISPVPIHTPIHIGLEYDLSGMVKVSIVIDKLAKEMNFELSVREGRITTSSHIECHVNKTNGIIVAVNEKLKKFLDPIMKEKLELYIASLIIYDDETLDQLEPVLLQWLEKDVVSCGN